MLYLFKLQTNSITESNAEVTVQLINIYNLGSNCSVSTILNTACSVML